MNNLLKDSSQNLIKITFPDDEKVVKLKCGEHHNLFVTESGKLYGNGSNSLGQIDGDLDSINKYQCVPKEIKLPSSSKIVDFIASNNRSAAILENGEVYYWGGIAYDPSYSLLNQPKYEGINLMNTELGLPSDCRIVNIGLGLFHDVVLVEENLRSQQKIENNI